MLDILGAPFCASPHGMECVIGRDAIRYGIVHIAVNRHHAYTIEMMCIQLWTITTRTQYLHDVYTNVQLKYLQ